MTHPNPALTFIIPIFIWSIYRRIKRNVGRQRLRLWRVILSLTIFSLLVVVFVSYALAMGHYKVLSGLLAGLATGIPVAFWGLKLTRFEFTSDGNYYTPNVYLGVGLSVLLTGRIIYRLLVLNNSMPAMVNPPPQFMQSALTLYLFGVAAGYYLTYYTGVSFRYHTQSRPARDN
jgi:hypothetical protein